MKRHGNLWSQIIAPENIANAHKMAKRGKGHYTAVKRVEANPELYLQLTRQALIDKTFTTGTYQVEDRVEGGKMRRIFKLPYYPDRIVQHAVLAVVGPILQRSFIRDTFQSLPGRGTSDARRRLQKLMRFGNVPRYAMKVDIRLFYPSVDNEILKTKIRRKIKCADTLRLLDDIVDSHQGLPIGNLSSQYFGNFYLSDFDWWVKQTLGVKHYYRYADDLVLFDKSKAQLNEIKQAIDVKLAELKLTLKPNWQIVDLYKQGIDFVGYVFKPESTRVRKSIAVRFKARAAAAWMAKRVDSFASLTAYRGWFLRVNAKRFWRRHVPNGLIRHYDGLWKTNPLRRAL